MKPCRAKAAPWQRPYVTFWPLAFMPFIKGPRPSLPASAETEAHPPVVAGSLDGERVANDIYLQTSTSWSSGMKPWAAIEIGRKADANTHFPHVTIDIARQDGDVLSVSVNFPQNSPLGIKSAFR